jgi:hypothetical protein
MREANALYVLTARKCIPQAHAYRFARKAIVRQPSFVRRSVREAAIRGASTNAGRFPMKQRAHRHLHARIG